LLYLSLYLKERRTEYYDALQRVRTDGDWEHWLEFFVTGVDAVAAQATTTAGRLVTRFAKDRDTIQKRLGRFASSALRVHDCFTKHGIAAAPATARALHMSLPTVLSAIGRLHELEVVREITGRLRNRQYVYHSISTS
jgi:Fic family protein